MIFGIWNIFSVNYSDMKIPPITLLHPGIKLIADFHILIELRVINDNEKSDFIFVLISFVEKGGVKKFYTTSLDKENSLHEKLLKIVIGLPGDNRILIDALNSDLILLTELKKLTINNDTIMNVLIEII